MSIKEGKNIFKAKENIDEITIIYKIDNNNNKLRVFGKIC